MRLDFHKNHRLLFGVSLCGFIGLSLVVAVYPALWVRTRNAPLPGSRPLTAAEQRGLAVYVAEGCVYCHTQQVRPIAQDTARYGRASVPGDYARLVPQDVWRHTPVVLGTERTGPDLSDVGSRQPSHAWHLIHLYQPRAVVPGSIMPSFRWLFDVKAEADGDDIAVPVPLSFAPDEGVVVARPAALDLVAYLLALRQVPLNDNETGAAAAGEPGGLGGRVYEARCSSCHQPQGEGVPGVFPALEGDPVVVGDDPAHHIRVVLFGLIGESIGGVSYATPMPGWAELLTDEEIAAVVNHERTSWGNNAALVTDEMVAELRRAGPNAR